MERWFEMDEVHWFIWVKSCSTGARRLAKSNVIMSNWLSHLRTPRRELSARKPADAVKWTATEEQEKFAGFETIRWWKRDGETETARAFRCAKFLNAQLFSLTLGEREKYRLSPWHNGERTFILFFFFFPSSKLRDVGKMWDCQRTYVCVCGGGGGGGCLFTSAIIFFFSELWILLHQNTQRKKKQPQNNKK